MFTAKPQRTQRKSFLINPVRGGIDQTDLRPNITRRVAKLINCRPSNRGLGIGLAEPPVAIDKTFLLCTTLCGSAGKTSISDGLCLFRRKVMGKRLNFFGVVLGDLFGLFFIVLPAAATQKAFLIGVGTYKHLPYITRSGEKLDNLRGPANDIQKIKELLVSVYHFSPDNILVSKGHEATRGAIISHFIQ